MAETVRLRCERPDCQVVFEADPADEPVRCSACGLKQDVDEARVVDEPDTDADEGAAQEGESTTSTTITPAEGISITITVNCPGACTGGDE